MANIDTKTLTIKKAHKHLKRGDFTVAELCDAYLKNIRAKNDEIHAFLEVFSDISEQAVHAQKMFTDGTATLMTGIPVAIKDNILVSGRRVGAASKILEGYVATYSGAAIQKLQTAGVVFMGRTNMDEFAMGSSTENSAYGPTKNPYDTSRVPGGSSGGAAAAIAMEGALVSLGSDTAGSVRQPAGFCGCVGLKTTYGTISRSGLIALGSSLDQIGPVTKTVEDSEIVFNTIRGQDPLDSTTLTEEIYDKARSDGAKKVMTVGVPRNLIDGEGIDEDVRVNFEDSIERLKKLGYVVKDINLPHVKYSLPTYYIMLPGEASSNLARFDGMKYGLYMSGDRLIDDYLLSRGNGFGPEPRRRILLGTYVLSSGYYDAYYNKSQEARKLITKDFTDAWKEVDIIITPTSPTPAFKFGEKTMNPVSMYLADVFTVPSNIADVPTISVPSGTVEREGKSLPLGIQFFAPGCREDLIFEVSKKFLGEVGEVGEV